MSRARAAAVLCVAALLTPATAARAQSDERERLGAMSAEELAAEGWLAQEDETELGSVVGGFLALTVGLVAHGAGHLNAGEVRTGRFLLITEGVSLGLMGLSLLTETLSSSDSRLAAVYESLLPAGASLFATTWLLDVIGAFKGGADVFSPFERSSTQLQARAEHVFLSGSQAAPEHLVAASLFADLGPVYLYPRARFGVAETFSTIGGEFGVRFSLGRRDYSFVHFGGEATRYAFDAQGYAYWAIFGEAGFSVDLGDLFSHLDGLVYRMSLGGGTQLFRFDFDSGLPTSSASFLGFETALAAAFARRVSLEVGYVQRPDELAGNLSSVPGAFFGMVTVVPSPRWSLHVEARAGESFQLTSGLSFFLFH